MAEITVQNADGGIVSEEKFRNRLKSLLTRRKLFAVLFSIFNIIWMLLDWGGRISFALEVAGSASKHLSLISRIISSPYFSLTLLVMGICYLLFVGEPKQGIQRHSWWPFVARIIFGICLTVMVTTVTIGYVEIYINKEVSKRDEMIQKQALISPVFWHLTDYQKQKLEYILDNTKSEKFEITISCLAAGKQSQVFGDNLASIFVSHNWDVTSGGCLLSTLKPDLMGLYLVISKDIKTTQDIPQNAQKLYGILRSAEIDIDVAKQEDMNKNKFYIMVGDGPLQQTTTKN